MGSELRRGLLLTLHGSQAPSSACREDSPAWLPEWKPDAAALEAPRCLQWSPPTALRRAGPTASVCRPSHQAHVRPAPSECPPLPRAASWGPALLLHPGLGPRHLPGVSQPQDRVFHVSGPTSGQVLDWFSRGTA